VHKGLYILVAGPRSLHAHFFVWDLTREGEPKITFLCVLFADPTESASLCRRCAQLCRHRWLLCRRRSRLRDDWALNSILELQGPYRSQRVLKLRLSCQVAGGGGVRSPNVLGSSEIVLLVVLLKRYLYLYNATKFFWPDLTFFARTRRAGCPCRDLSPTRHIPSHWDSLVDLQQHFK